MSGLHTTKVVFVLYAMYMMLAMSTIYAFRFLVPWVLNLADSDQALTLASATTGTQLDHVIHRYQENIDFTDIVAAIAGLIVVRTPIFCDIYGAAEMVDARCRVSWFTSPFSLSRKLPFCCCSGEICTGRTRRNLVRVVKPSSTDSLKKKLQFDVQLV